MKKITQKSKKGGLALLAALGTLYCIYLAFAGLRQAAGHRPGTAPGGEPLVSGHQRAPVKQMIRWPDSMGRITYK
jgi:hypothetical protein